jgi:predicted DNA-binding protein (MmcQ/YjbR family)
MYYNQFFEQYTFIPKKAAVYGFELTNGVYTATRTLDENGFYAVIQITQNTIRVNVYEEPDGELYLPFNTNAEGSFVVKIRADVDALLDDILKNCFELAGIKAILLDYVREKYGTVPEEPWDYLKEYHTLNTAKRHKWYGIFMLIPYRYLGVEKEGRIDVLNLKVKPDDIPPLIDHIHYFPAYHMNKKYWLSILLDCEADVEYIKKLLDDSYAIVEGKSRKDTVPLPEGGSVI